MYFLPKLYISFYAIFTTYFCAFSDSGRIQIFLRIISGLFLHFVLNRFIFIYFDTTYLSRQYRTVTGQRGFRPLPAKSAARQRHASGTDCSGAKTCLHKHGSHLPAAPAQKTEQRRFSHPLFRLSKIPFIQIPFRSSLLFFPSTAPAASFPQSIWTGSTPAQS